MPSHFDITLERSAFTVTPRGPFLVKRIHLSREVAYEEACERYHKAGHVKSVAAFIALMMEVDPEGDFVLLLGKNQLIALPAGGRGMPAFYHRENTRQLYIDDAMNKLLPTTTLVTLELLS